MDRLSVVEVDGRFEFSHEGIEEVKAVLGFTGYFISSRGRVFCTLGKGHRMGGKFHSPYPILGRDTRTHYLRFYAREDSANFRKDLYIHRMVGHYFLPRREGANVINHKNCDRHDNRVENLEWCTVSENLKKACESGHLVRNPKNGRFESRFDYRTVLSERAR